MLLTIDCCQQCTIRRGRCPTSGVSMGFPDSDVTASTCSPTFFFQPQYIWFNFGHNILMDLSNSDFDVNILEDALLEPTIDLGFPLPTDKEPTIQLDGNNPTTVGESFSILALYLKWFTNTNYDAIYADNEYFHSINKYDKAFHDKFKHYMDNKLERLDEKLNEIVYNLINQELNMNLTKASQFNERFVQVKDFMVKYYKKENEKNLPTFQSRQFLRIAYFTVMLLFNKMFPKGIWCKKLDFTNLYKQYMAHPMSIIFMPNHQSHIDYIIMHLLCVRFSFSTPSVIAGDNLNVAVFGHFLKNLGAIFIKRSFSNELYTERNLNNVIEFLLMNYVHFEVFIEGTRSRDGKLLLPKYGILKTLSNIFLKQRFEDKNKAFDMLMQPVSITYERIYEADGYLKELIGKDKKQESFVNIVGNGVKNMFVTHSDEMVYDKQGYNDNSDPNKKLNGKIFIRLGENFRISDFILDPNDNDKLAEEQVNLKKMGFKILHEINSVSYLPEVSIIGLAIHCYGALHGNPRTIEILRLLPYIRTAAHVLRDENAGHPTNLQIVETLLGYSDSELTAKVRGQIEQFFKLIRVNPRTNTIKVENPIELLYYKNLSIHLIIQRCMICFIFDAMQLLLEYEKINKLNYILTGFLKNEFLFDYNYDERRELTFILRDMVEKGILKQNDTRYEIADARFMRTLGNVVRPFLLSYVILILGLFDIWKQKAGTFDQELHKLKATSDKKQAALIDEDELRYPTTKTLLKYIISKNMGNVRLVESINKQYLLSDLYYLDNLRAIRIFKNKSKTKAFVKTGSRSDLGIVLQFLRALLGEGEVGLLCDDRRVNYIVDVLNKNVDRTVKL